MIVTAEAVYRAIWMQRCLAPSRSRQDLLDGLLAEIHARSFGEQHWQQFLETLPGYLESWEAELTDLFDKGL